MKATVFGAGLMGTAIAYDLIHHTSFDTIQLIDKNKHSLQKAEQMIHSPDIEFICSELSHKEKIEKICSNADVVISAVPYFFNVMLSNIAINSGVHFIDLGGNNDVVNDQHALHNLAVEHQVTIIPDLGLAPGLVSVITKDIVDTYNDIESVKLRVGGLPVHPKPPLNYEIVFSPNGLINEYMEDAIILDRGTIQKKPSMTEIETISFPEPFHDMEAFITSGGCSTLPYSFKDIINYLDYKTIRYKGHCEKFKVLLDLGLGSLQPTSINNAQISPRSFLINMLETYLPKSHEDVVLLKVISKCKKNNKNVQVEYEMIDYFDKNTGFTAMMRTTGFPVSITADLLAKNIIKKRGVYCPEAIIPPSILFQEMKNRHIIIQKNEKSLS